MTGTWITGGPHSTVVHHIIDTVNGRARSACGRTITHPTQPAGQEQRRCRACTLVGDHTDPRRPHHGTGPRR